MKINVMNDGIPCEWSEWHLNPATVCVAKRKRCEDGNLRYYLHTIDGRLWEVTMEDYARIVVWIEMRQ